jgi:transposase InsO family protein
VAADRFSGYPWVARLTSKTTGAVIAIMEKWFERVRLAPTPRLSDGGPQFRHEFEEWCTANNIIFELSSARNPASNGLAEAAVKQVKHLLEKIDGPSSLSRAMLALTQHTHGQRERITSSSALQTGHARPGLADGVRRPSGAGANSSSTQWFVSHCVKEVGTAQRRVSPQSSVARMSVCTIQTPRDGLVVPPS